jgi:hypothetical protein
VDVSRWIAYQGRCVIFRSGEEVTLTWIGCDWWIVPRPYGCTLPRDTPRQGSGPIHRQFLFSVLTSRTRRDRVRTDCTGRQYCIQQVPRCGSTCDGIMTALDPPNASHAPALRRKRSQVRLLVGRARLRTTSPRAVRSMRCRGGHNGSTRREPIEICAVLSTGLASCLDDCAGLNSLASSEISVIPFHIAVPLHKHAGKALKTKG